MPSRTNLQVILVLFGGLAVLILLTALTCGLAGLSLRFSASSPAADPAYFMLVTGLLACGVLLLPAAWHALRRLRAAPASPTERPPAPPPARPPAPLRLSAWVGWALLLVYPLVLLAGYFVSQRESLAWWALPWLHVAAALLPVYALVRLVIRRLPSGSPLRGWAVFGTGLVGAPAIILVIELTALGIAGILFLIQIASQRSALIELGLLAQRLQFASASPEMLARLLVPYLRQPVVLLGIFGFTAVLVPVVEELLKPLGMWLLARRSLTPADGFIAGVLSGAGYALFENLFIASPGEEWVFVSVARIGTSVMHMLAAGLTGWGLASAWQSGRYLRLGLAYLGAVLIHALWNGFTILSVVGGFTSMPGFPEWLRWAGRLAPVFLAGLVVALFVGLLVFNRSLSRYAIIPAPQSEPAILAQEPSPDNPES